MRLALLFALAACKPAPPTVIRAPADVTIAQWQEHPKQPSSVPSLFGAPHGIDGGCARGFVSATAIGPLCYRACVVDRDCPQGATCKADGSQRLCSAN